jgi:hypothetical protein
VTPTTTRNAAPHRKPRPRSHAKQNGNHRTGASRYSDPHCRCWSRGRVAAGLPIDGSCLFCGKPPATKVKPDRAIFKTARQLGIRLDDSQAQGLARMYGPNGGASRALRGMARRELLRRARVGTLVGLPTPDDNEPLEDGPKLPVYLHGPQLVAYLERSGLMACFGAENDMRRVQDWRRGQDARIDTVDRVLTAAARNLSELPDELYVRRSKRKRPAQLELDDTGKAAA